MLKRYPPVTALFHPLYTAFNLIFIIPLAASLTGAFGFASLGIRLAALIMSSRVH